MRSGSLRHQALLQVQENTQSASGAIIGSWTTVATPRVAIMPISGREFAAGGTQGRQARVLTMFRMRAIPGVEIVPRMRLLVGGKVFDIKDVVSPKGLNAELLVNAEELVEEQPT